MGSWEKERQERIEAARITLDAIRSGGYIKDGKRVEFPGNAYCDCRYVTPDEIADLNTAEGGGKPEYIVTAMDSFDALQLADNPETAVVLNFACATHPGGGFLSGSRAQEETLCRQSTLYGSLISQDARGYYENNAKCAKKLRPFSLLHSPQVFVFRNPDLSYKDMPVRTQVITAAAPNLKGKVRGVSAEALRKYIVEAARAIVAYAAGDACGADTLILGAWGCGAFGNSPEMVAGCFEHVLIGEWLGSQFKKIIFAIKDQDSENCHVFRDVFWPYHTDRKQRKKEGSMGRRFAKGDECYVVRKDSKTTPDKDCSEQWEKHKASVKSSGRKYVTVTSAAIPKAVFNAADKAILMSAKPGVYLVGTEEAADRLIERLSQPAEAAV